MPDLSFTSQRTRTVVAGRRRRLRADARANVRRIVIAAAQVLHDQPDARLEEIAAAARVSRSTIYRHFSSRERLVDAVRQEADDDRPRLGHAAGMPTQIEVADLLDEASLQLLGEQILVEAQRLLGMASIALYVVDVDKMVRLCRTGSDAFPRELAVPSATGSELDEHGLSSLRSVLDAQIPHARTAPLEAFGCTIGVLVATD